MSLPGNAVAPRTRGILLANVVAQVGIVVSGGVVRLTGSGLGCPTWPECTDASFVPVTHQTQGWHRYIEFGNRMLTFLLVAIAVASFVAVWRHRPRRRPLVALAGGVIAGIGAQAVLGGVSVLTGLNPFTVAGHFLLSMAVLAVSVVLYARAIEPGDGPVHVVVRRELRILAFVLTGLAATVLALGTVVTGSGPHSGDAKALVRFEIDPRVISWLHADTVILFIGLTVAMLLGARLTDAPDRVLRAAEMLLAAEVLQGVIGYTQYFTGLPTGLVTLHMLGACLVWVGALSVLLSTRAREGSPTDGAGNTVMLTATEAGPAAG